MALAADKLGLQIFVHAIGDAAVNRTLNGYEAVQEQNGKPSQWPDRRHRLEHIELIAPQDIPRQAQLGVIASMQPLHAPEAPNSGDIWPSRVGQERLRKSTAASWSCSGKVSPNTGFWWTRFSAPV
jgi:predicted amidohydrolase YtcJ